jgi:PAS domain S-box-containing protein
VSKDLNGIIATWNAGAERLFGYTAEEVVGKSIMMLIPPDRHDEEPEILRRIRRGERVDHYDTIRRRKDGSLVEISLTVSPVRDAEGRIIGASKIARDVTERKRAQERQRLLLREMNHRVKNLFTLAGGMVALSTRSARTVQELAEAVRARLGALSRAHDLTLPSMSEGEEVDARSTTLHALLQAIIAPFVDADDRVTVSGPDVSIGGQAVTGLALLLHELASNAAKFGALSSPSGSVSLDCSVRQDELMLTWRELGGPPLDGRPQSEGFGSMLTDATVSSQFGGQISRDWNREGLTVRLSLSLARLAAPTRRAR